ncbi:MAG TPA: transglycosylase SLT domain-containing protein [Xanthomonadaceae bacterium]|nr:transglycosylase SLT domain-containing protein [Xanthomonadaceae bacterium]
MSGRGRGFVPALVAGVLAACAAPGPQRPVDAPTPPEPSPVADAAARDPAPASPAPATAVGLEPEFPAPPPPPAPSGTLSAIVRDLAGRDCPSDRVVDRWRQDYLRSPQRFAASLERALPLLDYVARQAHQRGLPSEFALLPIVESWYRPAARNGGTIGMWQLSGPAARTHGLRVDAGADDRYLPAASTHAALSVLESLLERYGDWRLAAMAYNAGEYRVARALRSGDAAPPSPQGHQPPGLAMGTYEYLAKLLALRCIVLDPPAHGVQLPDGYPPPLTELTSDAGGAGLARALQRQGVDVAAFWHLNPVRSGERARARSRRLLIPAAAATPARQDEPVPTADATDLQRHRVRRGESLWLIARRHGLRLRDLLEWNRLDPEAPLMPGQWLRLEP